jgi:hypothetical protein
MSYSKLLEINPIMKDRFLRKLVYEPFRPPAVSRVKLREAIYEATRRILFSPGPAFQLSVVPDRRAG